MVENSENSILAAIGRFIAPVFAPLGFADWKVASALLTGFSAKEAVVSTLAVLTGSSTAELPYVLPSLFTPLSAYSFLIFTLLYTPCAAAIAAVKREFGSAKGAVIVVVFQTVVAWLAAFVFYNIGRLFFV